MADPTGEPKSAPLRLEFDRRLMLRFRGSAITSDGGLLAYRELDDAVDLTDTGADTLTDARTGKNGHHLLGGLRRQSVFGRLAGYEDVNDAMAEVAVPRQMFREILSLCRPAPGTAGPCMTERRRQRCALITDKGRVLHSRTGTPAGWPPTEAEDRVQQVGNPGSVGQI
jgi:hypothetical protein